MKIRIGHNSGRLGGFTLIELMIVVAVIGILSAIAYPSYTEHIKRGRRNDAKGALVETAQWLERNYTQTNTYNLDGAGTAIVTASLPIQQSPKDSTPKVYQITFGAVASSSYTVQAAPITGTGQAGDKCGTLTLDNTGARAISGGTGGATAADCWSR